MNFIFFHNAITNRDSIAQLKKVDLDALPFVVSGTSKGNDATIANIVRHVQFLLTTKQRLTKHKLEQDKSILLRQIASVEANIDQAVYELYSIPTEYRSHINDWSVGETRSPKTI